MGKIKKVKPQNQETLNVDSARISPTNKAPVPTDLQLSESPIKTKQKKVSNKISFEKSPTAKKAISKKEKRKNKHKGFLTKVNLIKEHEKEAIVQKKEKLQEKRRQKTAVTGDLKQLKDALPSLDELFEYKSGDIKTGVIEYDTPKTVNQIKKEKYRKRQRELVERMKRFTTLLKDPDYQKDARKTITNHIKFTKDLSDF